MHACAYVVGAESGPGTALLDLARRLGFQIVLPYGGVAQAEQQAASTPICFFLFAEVPDVRSMGSVAQAIRFSSGRRIRFSPMIYFSNNPSMEAIKACINMGFDDIITRPFTKTRVGIRLQRQLNAPLLYFETSSYFGPDRRRFNDGAAPAPTSPPAPSAERRGDGQYRRLEIMRHLTSGVNVLRDDLQVVL